MESSERLPSTEWSLMSSMLNIGAASICLLMGYIVNLVGRRRTMLLILAPFIAGWLLLILAVNPGMLIVGRALIGVACGGICVCVPVSCPLAYQGCRMTKEISFEKQKQRIC